MILVLKNIYIDRENRLSLIVSKESITNVQLEKSLNLIDQLDFLESSVPLFDNLVLEFNKIQSCLGIFRSEIKEMVMRLFEYLQHGKVISFYKTRIHEEKMIGIADPWQRNPLGRLDDLDYLIRSNITILKKIDSSINRRKSHQLHPNSVKEYSPSFKETFDLLMEIIKSYFWAPKKKYGDSKKEEMMSLEKQFLLQKY